MTATQTPILRASKLDTRDLDERWLNEHGQVRLLPAAEFRTVPHEHLVQWCHRHALYGLPTAELVQWLNEQIGPHKAIELAAGNAGLGRHLGILMTDSRVQEQDINVRAFYAATNQPPTKPAPDVLTLDAESAVAQLRPQVAIASWMTRKFMRGRDKPGRAQASIYGPREEAIISKVQLYIHIGNADSHGEKTALEPPHEKLRFPWLVSRAINPDSNVIYVWRRGT